MLKNLFILILIVILAAMGMVAAFKIMSWFIGVLLNLVIVIAVVAGILFLIRKLRTG